MGSMHSHRLGQVDRYREMDSSLDLPPRGYRENLEPGDLAMVLDETEDDIFPLWIEVEEVLGSSWYLGRTEAGHSIEFSADHIADLERRPRHSMGAWYDAFRPAAPKPTVVPGPFRHFAPGARRASPETPPPQPPPKRESRGSVFDVFRKGPGGSFFDLFKRKPKVDIEPIPPAERRRETHSTFLLPGPASRREPEERPSQEIIEPSELTPRAELTPIPQENIPSDIFSVLSPEKPDVEPVSQKETPGAVIIAPQSNLPSQTDAFSILSPGPSSLSVPGSPFDILESEPGALSIPGSSPFDVLAPESPGSLVARPSGEMSTSSVFDVLEPLSEVSVYVPPAPEAPQETVFSSLEPEKPAPRASERKQRKSAGAWRMPSQKEWIQWIRNTFHVEELFRSIEKLRTDPGFIEEQINEEENGEPAVIPLETWSDLYSRGWEGPMSFFGIPESVWLPYMEAIDKAEEKDGYSDQEWEEFNIQILSPLSRAI